MATLMEGSRAPAIDLPLAGGGRFNLETALAAGPVVLAFFKVSCPICHYAFPYYDRLGRFLQGRGVSVIGVSQDNEGATARFAQDCGVTFPIALDELNRFPVSSAYGLTNVPTLFEVDQSGMIVAVSVGWSRGDVEALYAKHVAEGGVAIAPLFQATETVADYRPG
ncbi:MAG TPA: TlpA disulfide reductase family protein [Clostridia bacterium]|nr:TlpA disulfide reductase family protein [Clostridia bacterium]